MEKLLFKTLKRKVSCKSEISSLEIVLVMSEFNDFYKKEVSIFDIIDCESLDDIYDLYK